MNRSVLIIGGTGILSTDVCRRALCEGYEVYMINRGRRNYNIEEHAHLIISDIRMENIEEIKNKINGMYFDVVIDFLTLTVSHLKKTLEIIKGQCNQYVFISSATVYKKSSEDEIITEETEIGNQMWDYAAHKVECELCLQEEYRTYCTEYTIIRPYVTYSHTRVPFAIISPQNWTFINRIRSGKPILLWNHGENYCTITSTKDFAVGVVGLFLNPKAYGEAFHITSDYTMKWKEVLEKTMSAVGYETKIVERPIQDIILKLPEYKGALCGDKATNMRFDNGKIKKVVPAFDSTIPYEVGIKDTIQFYDTHKELQNIDFGWNGRIDWYLSRYCYSRKSEMQKHLTLRSYGKTSMREKISYITNRFSLLYRLKKVIRGN